MILSGIHSSWLWLSTLAAVLAYGGLALRRSMPAPYMALLMLLAWLAHASTLALILSTGRFGFGMALSATAWLVLAIYMIESRLYPVMSVRWPLALMGAGALILGGLFPGNALQSKEPAWLALHAALGLGAYGLVGAAAIHASLIKSAETAMRSSTLSAQDSPGLPLLALERLMIGFVRGGFVLLTATLLAGWWFGEVLYGPGKAWTWNHKSVFSVASWLVLGALLLGHWHYGWRGRKAVRWVYGAAALLLLAYVGSRFVLEVLLNRP